MPKNQIKDRLGGPQRNVPEHNVGAVKAGSSNKFGSKSVGGGFKIASESFKNPPPPMGKRTGNTFKAKLGAA